MRRFADATEILKKKGIKSFISAVLGHLQRHCSGGISSRPGLEKIAGLFHPIYDLIYHSQLGDGTDPLSEDWDTLVLLDACRYDEFNNVNTLDGDLETRISKGTDSPQFIERNFCRRKLHDVVYVTANPHVDQIGDGVFYTVIDDPLNKWDSARQCVPPEVVTEAGLKAHQAYPNKRLIIHYMQPHDPPLGPLADTLRSELDLSGPGESGESDNTQRLMRAVAAGELSVDRAKTAYRETLDIVLSEVEQLTAQLDGKTVISSDHGELFGERYPPLGRLYGHYNHPRVPELCVVPWFTISSNDTRRKTTQDTPVEDNRSSTADLENQLKALGYT